MKSRLLIALASAVMTTVCVAADEAVVLEEFKTFAATEAKRLQQDFGARLMKNPRTSHAIGSEGRVIGGFDGMLDRYAIDLKRTDSLVSPYVGTIEVYGRFFSGLFTPRNWNFHATVSAYVVRYALQEGTWVIDPETSTPSGALQKGKDKKATLGSEWIPYAAGETNTPPGPLPE
jgi:hypothetical protein